MRWEFVQSLKVCFSHNSLLLLSPFGDDFFIGDVFGENRSKFVSASGYTLSKR